MSENHFERGFNAFSGLHEGLVLLKDLPKPSMPNRTYMSENHFKRGFNAFSGLHKGFVLLKDLSKPLMSNRTYMSENHFENMLAICKSNTSWIYMGFSAIERLI
jgi:Ca2+-binding EF-hand superfamily protein